MHRSTGRQRLPCILPQAIPRISVMLLLYASAPGTFG